MVHLDFQELGLRERFLPWKTMAREAPGEELAEVAFRLIVSESPELTTIRVAGRLGDDRLALLIDACARARRPLVLDLSELMGVSHAGALLLGRLESEGVHLLGASHYIRMLLAREEDTPGTPVPRRRRSPRPPTQPPAAERAR